MPTRSVMLLHVQRVHPYYNSTMGYTLLIDNYDSFTWNIYADIATLGGNPLVRRNDKISLNDVQVGPSIRSTELR
jgi:anthranilate synthase/indole-3-glycerol phosphate synthase/phosphoribosylanthranilate isomerase